ncbi:MAG: hypothetical protein H7A51_13520 [Akkermansiaceae bacterium]|nr:hypothetical protein [Akkermansiaceae bacterium]
MHTLYRALSTVCLSLVVGGISLGVTSFILVQYGWDDLPIDGNILNFVGFLCGGVLVLILHRRIHGISWIYRALGIVGSLGIVGGFIVYVRAYSLNESHIPMGPFDGIQYVLLMAFGICIIIVGALLGVSGGLGYISRKRIAKNLG